MFTRELISANLVQVGELLLEVSSLQREHAIPADFESRSDDAKECINSARDEKERRDAVYVRNQAVFELSYPRRRPFLQEETLESYVDVAPFYNVVALSLSYIVFLLDTDD